jgi:hypothetical protein
VMDNTGYWVVIESYIKANSNARLIEGLCPECARKSYGPGWEQLAFQEKE